LGRGLLGEKGREAQIAAPRVDWVLSQSLGKKPILMMIHHLRAIANQLEDAALLYYLKVIFNKFYNYFD
jgi:hypothetical protein